jgi:hypothetical protein
MACYVDLSGGLGDQLFQVATAYAHCKRHGYELRLGQPKNSYWHSYLHKLTGSRGGQNLGLLWREPLPNYTEIAFNALNLFGRFQSSKYFADFAADLRGLFQPVVAGSEKYGSLLAKPASIVVYLDGTCSPAYYERAIRHMQLLDPRADLILVTKDMDEIIDSGSCTVVKEPDEATALYFMSQFKYLVLSTSSLSWWAAWLAEKPLYVIAPTSQSLPEDFYEPNWDRMAQ